MNTLFNTAFLAVKLENKVINSPLGSGVVTAERKDGE
jgi:hypothetical protein